MSDERKNASSNENDSGNTDDDTRDDANGNTQDKDRKGSPETGQADGSDDKSPNTDDNGDGDDDVIKVERTSTSPALLSQLRHSRDYQQARGLGAGKTGVAIWRVQRMTALALIPLAIWFAVSVVRLSQVTQAVAAHWLAFPVNAVLMALFIVIMLRHAVIGIQIVLEDYVRGIAARTAWVLLVKACAVILGAASLAALIRLVAG